MYKGKATCKILKEIRKQIAKENDISFVTTECKYQGDCLGTCPACEAEVRYLEEELRKRKQLGHTAIVTGVSLGLATSFLGCHFDGDSKEPDTTSPLPEPTEQESTRSVKSTADKESATDTTQKSTQSKKFIQMTTDGMVATISDFEDAFFGDVEEEPSTQNDKSLQSDTIDIIYETPDFEPDGTVSSIRLSTLPEIPKDVCLQPSVAPQYPQGKDSCKKFIQQHIQISPKLKQNCIGQRIYFIFTIEKNGQVGKVYTSCAKTDIKMQKGWNKRCERAVKKAIRTMPRWIPGKDQDHQSARCIQSGYVFFADSIQVWLDD